MKKIYALTEDARQPLFLAAAVMTLLYFALILVNFLQGPEVVTILGAIKIFYFFLLGNYVGIKSLSKVNHRCNGKSNGKEYKKKPGQLFVSAWLVLYITMLGLGSFGIGHTDVIDDILWTVVSVLLLYTGTIFLDNLKNIITLAKKIWQETEAE